MKRALPALLATLILAACQDRDTVTQPAAPVPFRAATILQNDLFRFLSPLGQEAGRPSDNNESLSPTVVVCEWDTANERCRSGTTLASFTRSSGTGGTTIRVSPQQYHANWHTRESEVPVDFSATYRIRVLLGDATTDFLELGYVEFRFLRRQGGQSDAGIPTVVYGQTLPIRFWIGAGVTGVDCSVDCLEVTVSDQSDEPVCTTNGWACFDPEPGWLPPGYSEVTLTVERIKPDAAGVCTEGVGLPQREACYAVNAIPQVVGQFEVPIVFAMCPLEPMPDAYEIHQKHDNGTVERGQSVAFFGLDCSRFGPYPSGGLGLLDGATRAAKKLASFVFGAPLYARDGLGSQVTSFSDFFWAPSVALELVSPPPSGPPPGSTISIVYRVVTEHAFSGSEPAGQPIGGVEVEFSIPPGAGMLTDPSDAEQDTNVTATSAGNGLVAVDWTLPVTAGGHTLTAAVPIIVPAGEASLSTQLDVSVAPATIASIATGLAHACGLDPQGKAYCWGANAAGQLGDGSTTDRTTPVAVATGLTFTTLGAGWDFTCGLTSSGALYCWGGNQVGQFGDGTTTPSSTPVPAASSHIFVQIDVGSYHACGRVADGTAYCWGAESRNNVPSASSLGFDVPDTQTCDGYSGAPMWMCAKTPGVVQGNLTFVSISAGVFHTCGITASGATYCWGWNFAGQLGDGSINNSSISPVQVVNAPSFNQVVAGANHACGRTAAGAAYCWGALQFTAGQLGTGTNAGSTTPVPVAGGHVFASVAPTDANNIRSFTCGVTTSGQAYCWGADGLGEGALGTVAPEVCGFDSTPCATAPVQVSGGLSFSSVATGSSFACGTTTAGHAYCWGMNFFGQLGNGSTASSGVPVGVAAPQPVITAAGSPRTDAQRQHVTGRRSVRQTTDAGETRF
jgi:alpha-tubulin suppressor-like RCC1 family protein